MQSGKDEIQNDIIVDATHTDENAKIKFDVRKSSFVGLFSFLSLAIANAFSKSFFVFIFKSGEAVNSLFEKSFFYALFGIERYQRSLTFGRKRYLLGEDNAEKKEETKKNDKNDFFSKPKKKKKNESESKGFGYNFKRYFSLSVESSSLVKLYRSVIASILSAPFYKISFFFVLFGVGTVVTHYVEGLILGKKFSFDYKLFIPCIVAATFFFVILKNERLISSVKRSRILSTIFSEVLEKQNVQKYEAREDTLYLIIAALLGVGLGVFANYFTAISVLFVLLHVIGFCVLLYSPETGILLEIVFIPLSSFFDLKPLVFFVFASYVLKVMRGKRKFSLSIADFFVVSLLLYCFGKSGIVDFLGYAVAYISFINLCAAKNMIKKSVSCIYIAFILSLALLALQLSPAADYFGIRLTSFVHPKQLIMICAAFSPFVASFSFKKKNIHFGFLTFMFIASTLFVSYLLCSHEAFVCIAVSLFVFYVLESPCSLFSVISVYTLLYCAWRLLFPFIDGMIGFKAFAPFEAESIFSPLKGDIALVLFVVIAAFLVFQNIVTLYFTRIDGTKPPIAALFASLAAIVFCFFAFDLINYSLVFIVGTMLFGYVSANNKVYSRSAVYIE